MSCRGYWELFSWLGDHFRSSFHQLFPPFSRDSFIRSSTFSVRSFLVWPSQRIVNRLRIIRVKRKGVNITLRACLQRVGSHSVTTIFIRRNDPFTRRVRTSYPFMRFQPFINFQRVITVMSSSESFHRLRGFFRQRFRTFNLLQRN